MCKYGWIWIKLRTFLNWKLFLFSAYRKDKSDENVIGLFLLSKKNVLELFQTFCFLNNKGHGYLPWSKVFFLFFKSLKCCHCWPFISIPSRWILTGFIIHFQIWEIIVCITIYMHFSPLSKWNHRFCSYLCKWWPHKVAENWFILQIKAFYLLSH